MSTPTQIAANIINAQSSTGPRTEAGKAASSKNAITRGLFGMRDFIRPEEASDYTRLEENLQAEFSPAGVLECTLVDEIRRAIWRLRRCGQVEATLVVALAQGADYILDPMQSEANAKIQNSVDRARSQAHRLLHKCTAELRRLQAERHSRSETAGPRQTPAKPQIIPVTKPTQSQDAGTPRNAPCPCGSGQKHKRCCGRNAPPMLHAA